MSAVYPHKHTHTETHGWIGTAALPATSSLSFPPLSPWRQASRAGWLQTVVNQHRLKKGRGGEEEDEEEEEEEGGGGGVSLCLKNMTKRTLRAPRYLPPPQREGDQRIRAFRREETSRNILIQASMFQIFCIVSSADNNIHSICVCTYSSAILHHSFSPFKTPACFQAC